MTRSRITGNARSGVTVTVSSSVNVLIRVMHMQPRPAVDLGAARAALAGLAVPADGEVGRLGGLQPVDDVEDDLALVDLDVEVLELAVGVVAAPDPELARRSPSVLSSIGCWTWRSGCSGSSSSAVMYFVSSSSSNSASSSGGIGGSGCCDRR